MIQIISCMLNTNKCSCFLVHDSGRISFTNGCHGNVREVVFVT